MSTAHTPPPTPGSSAKPTKKQIIALIVLAFGLVLLIQPLSVLPALIFFVGLLALNAKIYGEFLGIDPSASWTELTEISFVIIMAISLVIWVLTIIVAPIYNYLTDEPDESENKRRRLVQTYIQFMMAYSFVAIFFWFIVFEFLFQGSFFMRPPTSIWNALASAINMLLDDWIAKYLKDTNLKYAFASYNSELVRNKLLLTITQILLVGGVLKSISSDLKAK
jgi:hypothetical protein